MFFYAKDQAGELCFYCNYGVYHGLCYDLLQYLAEYRRDDRSGIPHGIRRAAHYVACCNCAGAVCHGETCDVPYKANCFRRDAVSLDSSHSLLAYCLPDVPGDESDCVAPFQGLFIRRSDRNLAADCSAEFSYGARMADFLRGTARKAGVPFDLPKKSKGEMLQLLENSLANDRDSLSNDFLAELSQ